MKLNPKKFALAGVVTATIMSIIYFIIVFFGAILFASFRFKPLGFLSLFTLIILSFLYIYVGLWMLAFFYNAFISKDR
jgi:hypothetical protein